MATTTTFQLIRKQMYAKIIAITPAIVSGTGFNRHPLQQTTTLRDWAPGVGSAAWRKFEIRTMGPEVDAEFCDPAAKEVVVPARLTVAYPNLPGLTGTGDVDYTLDDLIASDAKQISDKVFSATNYLAGQKTTLVSILETDRSNPLIYFQDFELSVRWNKAQSLD